MSKISSSIETTTTIDSHGNETSTTIEKTKKIEVSSEPDYIKLYTKMWCEFNDIPLSDRPLFLELITRMTYCHKGDLDHSQLVSTGGPFADAICQALHWKNKVSLKKGLQSLVKCGAIKRVARGYYQINPSYASRGEWKYNPRLDRGGVEDLVATFDFKTKAVETKIVWADDGDQNPFNEAMRTGLDCKSTDRTVLSIQDIKKAS